MADEFVRNCRELLLNVTSENGGEKNFPHIGSEMKGKPQKIIFYNPHAVFFDMPLALMSIASHLPRDKYDVHIVDKRIDPQAHNTMLSEAADALCVGITVLTGAPMKDALELSRKLKAKFPKLPIVWGGWHPSLFPEATLRGEPSVDVTVQGQGEETFREIAERFSEGESLKGVAGCTFRDGDSIVTNPPRAIVDMNDLVPVDYDLIDVERYFQKKKRRQFDYISSAGCFFRCAFCADPFVFKRKWKGLDPERMGEEFAHWNKKFNFSDVNFQDETFFTYTQRSIAIAQQFLDRNIKATWAGTLRADQGVRMSDEEFGICVDSGLRRVLIGVESGTQEMMDWLKKDIKIEQVWENARRCVEYNVAGIFPFIVGFPGETDASVDASLNMAFKLSQMKSDFSTPIFYFKPYPGSEITQTVVDNGYELPETLEEWANFDYIGDSGPWVSAEKRQKVERFKFYNRLAGAKVPALMQPARWLAKKRCETGQFGMPIEKSLAGLLMPGQKLS